MLLPSERFLTIVLKKTVESEEQKKRVFYPSLPSFLLSQTESLNDGAVTLDVNLLKVTEKVSSVTYHLKKTAAAVVVALVLLQVLGEVVDSVCENRDLNLGRACVAFSCLVLGNNCLLFFLEHHFDFTS